MPDTLTHTDSLLTPEDLAREAHSNPRTLERWRSTGTGPMFVKFGRRVLYKRSDVNTWLEQQRRQHTAKAAGR